MNSPVKYSVPFTSGFTCFTSYTVHTETAFLHDAATSDGYIRVEVISERFWPYWFPVVEKPNDIWTTIRTVPGTYTAVVHLNIHAFSVVVSCINGAHGFTRGIFAMLAHDRNKSSLCIGEITLPVALDANP